jgi:hypothetical protein
MRDRGKFGDRLPAVGNDDAVTLADQIDVGGQSVLRLRDGGSLHLAIIATSDSPVAGSALILAAVGLSSWRPR